MKQYIYKNYKEYVSCQRAGFEKKKDRVWCIEENIKAIADYLKPNNPSKGICHGTRGGYEQIWFMKYLADCEVIGTEIGDFTAPNTIQCDFNQEYPDLVGKFDFLYSNSFDHAFEPQKTAKIWFNQLNPGGFLILEWDKRQEHTGDISKAVNKLDCVSLTFDELQKKIIEWCPVTAKLEILDMPVVTNKFRKALIVQKQG
jgi:hypothetical protein